MSSLAAAVLLVASLASDVLHVGVDRGPEELAIRFELLAEMPESVVNTVSSGARIEIDYPVRVYGRRKMFPDRRIWKGVARSTVTFDAITGRYLCQLIVNGSTTVSREVDLGGGLHQELRVYWSDDAHYLFIYALYHVRADDMIILQFEFDNDPETVMAAF